MKYIAIASIFLLSFCSSRQESNVQNSNDMTTNTLTTTSFYDLKVPTLDEQDTIDFADFKGKKVLLVNVASKCGYTPQYEGLQKLYETYGDSLIVIGFPCNQFMGQEPGSNDEIAEFCSLNYGVKFPLSTKINVKGSDIHPVYAWLTQKDLNGRGDYSVSWNFNKFVIDENGELLGHFGSNVKPFDTELLDLIR